MLKRLIAVIAAMSTAILTCLTVPPASADIEQQDVVTENPLDTTPHILDGTVHAVAVVGDTVIVGGEFTQVREAAAGSPTLSRTNLFAYDHATGQIDSAFTPQVDDEVLALEPGPDSTVYVGGLFSTVNDETHKRLARLNVADGTSNSEFVRSQINWGNVTTLAMRGGNLYIGGRFDTVTDTQTGTERHILARLDADTGAVDPDFDITVSEPRSGELVVKNLAVDPDETELVIDGTFTKVNGEDRYQIAVIDLTATPVLSTWVTSSYSGACEDGFNTYMREIDFSPDGSYFIVVTAGGLGSGELCSTATRWESGQTGPNQQPTWANHTGGDSLFSVSVTGAAVYVGGHQRWMDNPEGNNDEGPGAVPRQGIAAIDPTSGKSADIDWNPTRTRGHGAEALIATPVGLLVGSDTDELGGEYHGRIGEFPLPETTPHAAFTIACDGTYSCDFNASASTAPHGTIISYLWDFGDNTTGKGQQVTHKYSAGGNYPVRLRVVDDAGLDAEAVKTVTLNLSPTAAFKVSCENSTHACTFDASGSQDTDGTITAYQWDFGDNSTGSGATVTHTFDSIGTYEIRLTVTDNEDATGTTSRTLAVSDENTSPTASFTSGCTDSIRWCSFDASASQDPDGSITSYAWDFGDGTTETGKLTQHTYTNAGTYTVQLATTDDKNATAVTTKQITVGTTGTNRPPQARFSYVCPVQLHCEFDAAGSEDSDGTITTYEWSFGDGTTGTGNPTTHDYDAEGTYTVTLTVTDDSGAQASTTKQVTPH